MRLSNEILDEAISATKLAINTYNRENNGIDKQTIKRFVKLLYEKDVDVIWLDDKYEIRDKVKKSKKPWVYHYSLNLNWIVFFKHYLKSIEPELDTIGSKEYVLFNRKIYFLEKIFQNVDGILEDGDVIYLIKDDINFLNVEIKKWTT